MILKLNLSDKFIVKYNFTEQALKFSVLLNNLSLLPVVGIPSSLASISRGWCQFEVWSGNNLIASEAVLTIYNLICLHGGRRCFSIGIVCVGRCRKLLVNCYHTVWLSETCGIWLSLSLEIIGPSLFCYLIKCPTWLLLKAVIACSTQKRAKPIWAPLYLVWRIWRERNRWTIEKLEMPTCRGKSVLLYSLNFWFKGVAQIFYFFVLF